MHYENFELELFNYSAAGGVERFEVRVLDSPALGQLFAQKEKVQAPEGLKTRVGALEDAAEYLTVEQLQEEVRGIGEAVAQLLFPPGVRQLLLRSHQQMRSEGGLRIRLRLNDYQLADFPWEYAFLAELDELTRDRRLCHLALNPRFSLVRYELQGDPVKPITPIERAKLRAAGLFASPTDGTFEKLELDQERRLVADALALANVPLLSFADGTPQSLDQAVAADPHTFHFAGHAEFDAASYAGDPQSCGFIILCDEDGKAAPYSATEFARKLMGRSTRLVTLGACETSRRDSVNPWTGVVAALTRVGIPAVIGMQYPIGDGTAAAFDSAFYRVLTAGEAIDSAVTAGRNAIYDSGDVDGVLDFGVPALYLHANESVLFPPPVAVDDVWRRVSLLAGEQSKRLLETSCASSADCPFDEKLYVHRADAEAELSAFLESDARAMIVCGEPGAGKTTLLCRWIRDLQSRDEYAVLAYDCGGALRLDVAAELARDLEEEPRLLPQLLQRIDREAAARNGCLVIVFDALNEFRRGSDGYPRDLLREINGLVERLPGKNVRVVVSCSHATWTQLTQKDKIRLARDRYYKPVNPAAASTALHVTLAPFDSAEFEAAFDRYREHYKLQTSHADLAPALVDQLRNPLMLSMVAEAWRGRALRVDSGALGIVRSFFQEFVKREEDRAFVDTLAKRMLAAKRDKIAVAELILDPSVRGWLDLADPASAVCTMQNRGVVILKPSDGGQGDGDDIKFTSTQLAAFVLASHVARRAPVSLDTVRELVGQVPVFALAWETAGALVLLQKDDSQLKLLADLARSLDPELRELAVESLVRLFTADQQGTLDVIRKLLDVDSDEARRTALRAAFCVGSAARDLLLEACSHCSLKVRDAVKDTLYLIWRNESLPKAKLTTDTLYLIWRKNPGFTHELMRGLIEKMSLNPLGWVSLKDKVIFILQLSIAIYTNHCDVEAVIDGTDATLHDLATHLHLDRYANTRKERLAEKVLLPAAAASFSRPLLGAVHLGDVLPKKDFFHLPRAKRNCLERLAPLLDPATELDSSLGEIERALRSDVVFFSIAASLVLATHATADFERVAPQLRGLFDRLNGRGRLWLVAGFSVLFRDTPLEWRPMLEDFTRRLVTEHPDLFDRRDTPLLKQLDLLFVPVGLCYGKSGTPMSLLREILAEAAERRDVTRVSRCVSSIGAVGFYYPEGALAALRESGIDMKDPTVRNAMAGPLGTMRLLHLEAVDAFLSDLKDVAYQRRVAGEGDLTAIHRYVYWIGLYNNAVHYCVRYPAMRDGFGRRAFTLLSSAKNARQFATEYGREAYHMFRDSGFHPKQWTVST